MATDNKFKRQYEQNLLRYGNEYGPAPNTPVAIAPAPVVSDTPDVQLLPSGQIPVTPPADVYGNALSLDNRQPPAIGYGGPGQQQGGLGLAKAARTLGNIAYKYLGSAVTGTAGPAEAAYAAGAGPAALPGGEYFGGATLPSASGAPSAGGMFSSLAPTMGMGIAMGGVGLMVALPTIIDMFGSHAPPSHAPQPPAKSQIASDWAQGKTSATGLGEIIEGRPTGAPGITQSFTPEQGMAAARFVLRKDYASTLPRGNESNYTQLDNLLSAEDSRLRGMTPEQLRNALRS